MIAQIEDAIMSLLQGAFATARVAVQKGYEGIPQPAIYIGTEEGRFIKVGMAIWRQETTIYIDIIFKSLKSEQARRQALYPMLESVIQILAGQTLGLDIHPIHPKAFRNVTTEEMLRDGFVAYSFEIETDYHINFEGPVAAQEMLNVAMSYYLSMADESLAPSMADTPVAEDLVELPE